MKLSNGLWAGLTTGPPIGALVGLLDCGLAAFRGGTILSPDQWLPVLAIYAAAWIPVGLLAGFVSGLFFRDVGRAVVVLLFTGSLVFVVGAYVNVELLPSFTAPSSLLFDGILLAVGVASFLALFLLQVPVPRIGARGWVAVFLVPFAIAGFAPFLLGEPDDEGAAVEVLEDGLGPNVLIFMVDALRADHLGAYGYERDTSPQFDEFARGARVFDECRVASSWTKPSTASIFTGLQPTSHGAVEHRDILSRRAVTMAEVFKAAGYRTAAFSDNPFISPEFGFDQGFDVFEYESPSVFVNGTLLGKALWTLGLVSMSGEVLGESLARYKGSAKLCKRFLRWVADDREGRPWFAYIHAMEPHLPYDPPAPARGRFSNPAYHGPDLDRPPSYKGFLPFETAPELPADQRRHLVDRYDEEIRTWDEEFGQVLTELHRRSLTQRTIVVVLSDHGEEFYEHKGWTHGHSLHEELLRVPLAVRGPGITPGREKTPACAIGLAELLFNLAGIRPMTPWPAPSLLVAGERPSVSELKMGGSSAFCIVMDGKKLIVNRRGGDEVRQAFNLRLDPGEQTDAGEAGWIQGHQLALDAVLDAAKMLALDADTRELSPQEREALRGLGYTR